MENFKRDGLFIETIDLEISPLAGDQFLIDSLKQPKYFCGLSGIRKVRLSADSLFAVDQ